MPDARFQHLIVLMLENRSFDHMFGYLGRMHPYPAALQCLTGNESNDDRKGQPVPVSDSADYAVQADSNHTHAGVIQQLLGVEQKHPAPPYDVGMRGFVRANSGKGSPYPGSDVMRCFAPEKIPCLATLACQFAVCNYWFCSVPGETWPNRQFAHAGTSHGTVDIEAGFYFDTTIFQQLADWRIYHQGPPQVWAFLRLWLLRSGDHFKGHQDLLDDIAADRLPQYAFVEPDHGLTGSTESCSQHPNNNKGDGRDFLAGEALIRRIYEALYRRPAVFERTLFLVTYDEHGGFFDHVAPPWGKAPAVAPDPIKARNGFAFDLLGPRVPAVMISPLLKAGAVDDAVYDHCAIPATARALFAPGAPPLTRRVEVSATFPSENCFADAPRDDLPDPDALAAGTDESAAFAGATEAGAPPRELDRFQESLVRLAEDVDATLDDLSAGKLGVGVSEMRERPPTAARVPRRFQSALERAEFLRRVEARIKSR